MFLAYVIYLYPNPFVIKQFSEQQERCHPASDLIIPQKHFFSDIYKLQSSEQKKKF